MGSQGCRGGQVPSSESYHWLGLRMRVKINFPLFFRQIFCVAGLAASAGAWALLGAGVAQGERTGQEPTGQPGQRHHWQGCLPHPEVSKEGLCCEVRV